MGHTTVIDLPDESRAAHDALFNLQGGFVDICVVFHVLSLLGS
jgi:hypothetical protein